MSTAFQVVPLLENFPQTISAVYRSGKAEPTAIILIRRFNFYNPTTTAPDCGYIFIGTDKGSLFVYSKAEDSTAIQLKQVCKSFTSGKITEIVFFDELNTGVILAGKWTLSV
jgi:hypothetical protein